jgi:hypothetical protein
MSDDRLLVGWKALKSCGWPYSGMRCDSKSHHVLLYQCQYIPRLLYTAQAFFKNQFFDKSFSQTRHKLFFKIDYYDNDMRYRSEDPSDHSRASPY